MHLPNTFLHFDFDFDLLVFGQLDNGYAHLLVFVLSGVKHNGLDRSHFLIFSFQLIEDSPDVQRGHFKEFIAFVHCFEDEIAFAYLAVFNSFVGAAAGPGVLKLLY